MSKRRLRVINSLAILLWLFTALIIGFAILWNYPRQTVVLENYRVVDSVKDIGQNITVTSNATVYMNGQSVYDHRLVCIKGRYLLKSLSFNTSPRPKQFVRGNVGAVPVIERPDECRVSTTKCHTINVIFGISRTYCDIVETNNFKVN